MNKYSILLIAIIFLTVFQQWFLPGLISAGDFWPYYKSMYTLRSIVPMAWDPNGGYGMGANSIPFLWIHMNFGIGIDIFGKLFGFEWAIVERLYYLFPLLIGLTIFPYLFYKKLFPNSKFGVISSVVYGANTYILMIIGGGQLHGVGMAYAILPLILWLVLSIKPNVRSSAILSLFFALVLLYDIRFFYILLLMLPFFVAAFYTKNIKKAFGYFLLLPILLACLIHAFWVLPLVLFPTNPIQDLGEAYSGVEAVKFFSFAKLENSLSLLHPNWFQNIFGKVGFMRPEFLVIPIVGFLPLIYLNSVQKSRKVILFFAALILIGAFLAKGANDPFGNVFLLLFEKVPGFQMFRDPTKFYAIVALGFSVLIPFSIELTFTYLKKRGKVLSQIFLIACCLYFILTLWPAISGQLLGTFKTTEIPQEYKKLEIFLRKESTFYRTLWVPDTHRFGYYNSTRPSISFNSYKINLDLKTLQEMSVKYVIVPYDMNGEIYVTDRKYDDSKYIKAIHTLKKQTFLREIEGFGKIRVFEVPSPKDHFWSEKGGLIKNFEFLNPTRYKLYLSNANKGDVIVFSEKYDAYWFARIDNQETKKDISRTLTSNPYKGKLNSFTIREDGSYTLEVFYLKQKYVELGTYFSLIVMATLIMYIIVSKYYEKKKSKS